MVSSMDGMLIKPPDFNPSRRYPVYQFTYAGPGAAQVRDQWGGTDYMFHQMLAQHGIVVWILDNRSASGKGAESQWPVYGRLGELELQDLEDGVTWLKQQTWVDPSRLVLSGWSYGGFMTAYALTHSTSWSAGIVGAPVTDWRDYDSVYTERLMKMPQHNADGYRRTAPRFAADRLNARMLLIHGTMDDNVHMQNSVQFAYELQKAGKPFEMMVYAEVAARVQRSPLDRAPSPDDVRLRDARDRADRPTPARRHASRCWSRPLAARPPSSPWSFALREPSWVRWRAWTPGSTATMRSADWGGIAFRLFSPIAPSARRKRTACGISARISGASSRAIW